MNKEKDASAMYTCKLRDGFYCKLRGMKPSGSIAGDTVGPRFCIQPILVEHKRGIKCNKKSLIVVKEEIPIS